MAKPLDGIAFSSYARRLKFSKEAQELLKGIRHSLPSRTPEARKGNMPVWYPSKKMQYIIKAESHKVEFAFLLAVEHDDVLEVWDQPRPLTRLSPEKEGKESSVGEGQKIPLQPELKRSERGVPVGKKPQTVGKVGVNNPTSPSGEQAAFELPDDRVCQRNCLLIPDTPSHP
jgi:hypothetical protein